MIFAFSKQKIPKDQKPSDFFERVRGKYAFLLNIKENDYQHYTCIGYDPFLVLMAKNNLVTVLNPRNSSSKQKIKTNSPLKFLRDFFLKYRVKNTAEVFSAGRGVSHFAGGAAGFFSYDFGVKMMGIKQKTIDDTSLPDFVFCFADKLIIFDHRKKELYFVGLGETPKDAENKVKQIKKDIERERKISSPGKTGILKSNMDFPQYKAKISAIKKLLYSGETYQVNFSQRFSGSCSANPWEIYKNIEQGNVRNLGRNQNRPSASRRDSAIPPYSCYFEFPDFQIVSASPELLFQKHGNIIETLPIKGTVPRGGNSIKDAKQIRKLLASEKDAAELAMIVDLERNDLGRVCKIGSVKVVNNRAIQKLSHVIHTFARIKGLLRDDKDIFDLIEALFPGGSITGCPKKRTVEIIDKLEDFKRGVYTGSAGFIGFNGDVYMNILIRTMLFKDKKVYFQVGGGIVADSNPKKEYEETLDKARGLFKALKENL